MLPMNALAMLPNELLNYSIRLVNFQGIDEFQAIAEDC
jgi:hypothetical protein